VTPIKAPCAKCPFRAKFKGEQDYLRPGRRAEIALSVLEGAEFPCHETVDYDTEDEDGGPRMPQQGEVPCVGLDIVMLRAGQSGQMQRIRERIGMLDPARLLTKSAKLKMWDWDEITLDDLEGLEGEPCSVVGPDCEAPAGYSTGSGVIAGTDMLGPDQFCHECGEPVCESCMDDPEHACVAYREAERERREYRLAVIDQDIRMRRGAPAVNSYTHYTQTELVPQMATKMKATRRAR